jgi:hypothetical protein
MCSTFGVLRAPFFLGLCNRDRPYDVERPTGAQRTQHAYQGFPPPMSITEHRIESHPFLDVKC